MFEEIASTDYVTVMVKVDGNGDEIHTADGPIFKVGDTEYTQFDEEFLELVNIMIHDRTYTENGDLSSILL